MLSEHPRICSRGVLFFQQLPWPAPGDTTDRMTLFGCSYFSRTRKSGFDGETNQKVQPTPRPNESFALEGRTSRNALETSPSCTPEAAGFSIQNLQTRLPCKAW